MTKGFDPLEKYKEYQRTEGGYAPAAVPRETQVIEAHKLRRKLWAITGLLIASGLLVLWVFAPSVFFPFVGISALALAVVLVALGLISFVSAWFEVSGTIGRAKLHGVVRDE